MGKLPVLLLLFSSVARTDCLLSIGVGALPPFSTIKYVFPNWQQVPTTDFSIWACDDVACNWCTTSNLRGVTIVNMGTATGGAAGDITGMYIWLRCNGTGLWPGSGMMTMEYRGMWDQGSGPRPTWTWSGNFALMDPCDDSGQGCKCNFGLFVYTDIGSCPTENATIQLARGYNDILNPLWAGGVYDSCNCAAWGGESDNYPKTIKYVVKEANRQSAAPGDTVEYSIYFGKPGAGATVPSIWITDTQPAYTHLAPGFGGPPPDSGWDPNPGPPMVLRWTFNNLPTAGGPTSQIDFAVMVDWGNTEAFEPGSGDVAAPEGEFLYNSAHMAWDASVGCASGRGSGTLAFSVRRYLFWMTADNDLLFSSSMGAPDDEITYEIFMKNVSDRKTWWDVRVWDTVPAELDPWAANCGLEDPCVGWTMTPWGCPPASAGRILVPPASTLLTWRLDMPPGMTLALRWKARVRSAVPSDSTALNRVALLPYGRPGVVEGTGHAGRARIFTHEAPVLLRTTYVSYMGMAAAASDFFKCEVYPPFDQYTYFISFYPLNKMTNFMLYRQEHTNDAWTNNGGASPPINQPAGGCQAGGAEWLSGCKAERIPAFYLPAKYSSCSTSLPFHDLYKLVSNSPVLWELPTSMLADTCTWAGTTSLTYAGYAGYTFLRMHPGDPFIYDGLHIVNTSDAGPTTSHLFSWNAVANSWDYVSSTDIGTESQWFFAPAAQNSYRIISSDSRMVLWKICTSFIYSGWFNGMSAMAPNIQNGLLVNSATPAKFYAYCGNTGWTLGCGSDIKTSLHVGNVGAANATYEVWEYLSNSPGDTPPIAGPGHHLKSNLYGSAGQWVYLDTDTVPAGQFNNLNAHVYSNLYDATLLKSTYGLYKIILKSGGPIQVYNGRFVMDSYGSGSVMHASSGTTAGTEFWHHMSAAANHNSSCNGPDYVTMNFDLFIPKKGVAVQATAEGGYSARYTTDNPDECISFRVLTPPVAPNTRNWVFTATGGQVAVAQDLRCHIHQKIYTAPFLAMGVHYNIIAPPVVYLGQNFWITVIVVEVAGTTKADYNGITSFSGTDPGALIEGTAMAGYDYDWQGTGFEDGVRIFVNVTMTQIGLQTVVAQDTEDGSISGLTAVQVVAADVKLTKEPRLTIASSGEAIQFRVCWSNYSSATASNFIITDAVPMGTSYIPEAASLMFCGAGGPAVPNVIIAYGTASATTPGTFNTLTSPTQTAPASTRWLRWTVQDVYVYSTGCVCFRVRVD